jgi:hypothetical protein
MDARRRNIDSIRDIRVDPRPGHVRDQDTQRIESQPARLTPEHEGLPAPANDPGRPAERATSPSVNRRSLWPALFLIVSVIAMVGWLTLLAWGVAWLVG